MIPTTAKNRKQKAKERMHQAHRVIGPACDDVARRFDVLKISMDTLVEKLKEVREATTEYEKARKAGGSE